MTTPAPTPSAPSLSDEDIHAIANDHGTRDRYMAFARAVIDADRSLRAAPSLSDEEIRSVHRQLEPLRAELNARNYPVNKEDFQEYAAVIVAAVDRSLRAGQSEPVAAALVWKCRLVPLFGFDLEANEGVFLYLGGTGQSPIASPTDEQLATVVEALRPFARLARQFHGCPKSDRLVSTTAGDITVGHLRAALAALAPKEPPLTSDSEIKGGEPVAWVDPAALYRAGSKK